MNPEPPAFKIATSQIRGWHENQIDLRANAPEQLSDRGDYRGAGTVMVAFNGAGKVLGMIYVDQLRATDASSVVELSTLGRLNALPGFAFMERMTATANGKLKIQYMARMTELVINGRSNIGLTGSIVDTSGAHNFFVAGKEIAGAIYTVHLYQVMRLRFDMIVAGTHEQAAEIAKAKTHAGETPAEIEACDGQVFSALVDLGGGENFDDTRLVKFVDSTDLHNLAADLLQALKQLRESPEAISPDNQPMIDTLIARAEGTLAD